MQFSRLEVCVKVTTNVSEKIKIFETFFSIDIREQYSRPILTFF